MSQKVKVFEILRMQLIKFTSGSGRTDYVLWIDSRTSSSNWSNLELVEAKGPKDSFINFELVGVPPADHSISVMTPHRDYFWLGTTGAYTGVRVNDQTIDFEDANPIYMQEKIR